MLRRISYRTAVNLFVFTGLWLLIGAVIMWTPVPGTLGISGAFFVLWLMLFFAILAVAGATLTAAAINGAFPPSPTRSQRRRDARQAEAMPPRRPGALWAPDTQRTGATRRPDR
jgi:hypothetical protein